VLRHVAAAWNGRQKGPNDRGLTYTNPIATVLKRLAIELHKA
jgi:hypothetical protein